MLLDPAWRTRIVTAVAVIAGLWMGVAIAQGDSLPVLAAVTLLVFIVTRWLKFPLSTLLLGLVIVGYILGNRGFAQLSVTKLLPILPAEAVLAVAGALLCVQCLFRHDLPFRREPLNLALLLWMVVGAARIVFDLRVHGFMALRDFAMVYYAAFFYLGQEAGRDPAGRVFLRRALLGSCALLLPASELFNQYPDFFLTTLTVRGVPLIFFKGDLVGTFLAVGSVWFFLRYEAGRSRWNIAASLVFGAAVLATQNRASMLGLIVATAWLAAGRRWRFAAYQAAGGAIAVALILLGATLLNVSWEKTPVFGLYERAISLVDTGGTRVYRSDDSLNKGDNNTFRRVWWGAVIDEVMEGNPYVGLGFGADLAERFVREYYADSTEEFTARSPHNFLLTTFARMGVAGLVTFLLVLAIVARRTWQAIHAGPVEATLWCAVWVMFVSACLGVVLEGPMGAVVFWTMLGLANAEFLEEREIGTSDREQLTEAK